MRFARQAHADLAVAYVGSPDILVPTDMFGRFKGYLSQGNARHPDTRGREEEEDMI